MGILGSTPTRVATDVVAPLPFFDDAAPWKAFILYSMFVFDDVLDPDKLRDSLTALAQRDGWRKLSARLRQEGNGFVYHLPTSFSKERPALAFSHVVYDMPAAKHAIASKLPSREGPIGTRPEILGDPRQFQPLFYPDGSPTKLKDYLTQDIPQLGLHVVSFTDKTIVTLSWPHTCMDAMGKRSLLDAWILMLQGRADEVPTPEGAPDSSPDSFRDPLLTLGTAPSQPYVLADRAMSLPAMALYALRNIGNFIRTHENRIVRVPAVFIKGLRAKAEADLAAVDGAERPAFVSDSDILCAWWVGVATKHLVGSNGNRSVTLNMAMSLRGPLAGELFTPQKADGRVCYISNAVSFLFANFDLNSLATQPLGVTAAAIRSAIEAQRVRSQIEAYSSLWRAAPGKVPPLMGDSGMHMVTISNWCKANLFEMDFSAAIVKGDGSIDSNIDSSRSGRPCYIQNSQFGLILPDGFPIIGKDLDGNIWLSGYMNPGVWASVEADLAKIPL